MSDLTPSRLKEIEANIKKAQKANTDAIASGDVIAMRKAQMELMHANSVKDVEEMTAHEAKTGASTASYDLQNKEKENTTAAEQEEPGFFGSLFTREKTPASEVVQDNLRRTEKAIYEERTAQLDQLNEQRRDEVDKLNTGEYSAYHADNIDSLDRQIKSVQEQGLNDLENSVRLRNAIDEKLDAASSGNGISGKQWDEIEKLEQQQKDIQANAERETDIALGIAAAEESVGLSQPKPFTHYDADAVEKENNNAEISNIEFVSSLKRALGDDGLLNLTPPSEVKVTKLQLNTIDSEFTSHYDVEETKEKFTSSVVPHDPNPIKYLDRLSLNTAFKYGNIQPVSTMDDEIANDLSSRDDKNNNTRRLNKEVEQKLRGWTDSIHAWAGKGSRLNPMNSFLYNLDRNQLNAMLPNHECADITLMTRPCLPMQSSSLKQDDFLSLFDTVDPNSMAFVLRCYMDTFFSTHKRSAVAIDAMNKCSSFNNKSPWLIPVCNGITSISGFPDPYIETETTEGGFHQEDQTYAKGGLGLFRSVDLNLTFSDPQGGPLMLLFQLWITCIQMLRSGQIMAYKEFVDAQMIPYTVSIYRFNLDPSKTFITNFCKVTGCFPKSVPIGAIMNTSENERYISSAGRYSIPFVGNVVEYNRPSIIYDFNALARRYCPGIENEDNLPNITKNNMYGLPYIVPTEGGLRYVHKDVPDTYIWDDYPKKANMPPHMSYIDDPNKPIMVKKTTK